MLRGITEKWPSFMLKPNDGTELIGGHFTFHFCQEHPEFARGGASTTAVVTK